MPAAADAQPARPPAGAVRGVVFDWGGVLTGPITDTVRAWLAADQISPQEYRTVMRAWLTEAYTAGAPDNPVHRLERGDCTDEDFETELASRLHRADGSPVPAAGLLGRMFAASRLDDPMHELLRRLRQAGLKTALLSNSWGQGSYPRELFGGLFDVVVISAEVGMRKPEPRIFAYTARELALAPQACVFVDDVEHNVAAAQAAGFLGIHHHSHAATMRQLARLTGVALADPAREEPPPSAGPPPLR